MATDLARVGPSLCDLPLESLQEIASYLAGSYRPSLCAFSQTNKACHQASTLFIFHQINLRICTHEKLQNDVASLSKTLSRTDSARHVHCISLRGFLDIQKPRNERGFTDTDPLAWWNSLRADEIFPDKEPVPSTKYFVYDESVISENSDEDKAWALLVNFIKTLPSLRKLVYNCPNQFPPSLLYTLHENHPQCKLHHLTFRLRTLLWDTPYPYETALATSPCLYSVKVVCSGRDSDGDDDFNQEATMELVAGLAPNLREVTMIHLSIRHSKFTRDRAQWSGLPGFVPGMSGSLTSLSLVGQGGHYWRPEYIQTWARFTDFGSLRRLTIAGPGHRGVDGEVMGYIAKNHSFPQLRALSVCLDRQDASVERPDFTSNAVPFFTAFEPLEELSVSGPLEPEILDAILHRHGRTLKRLTMRPDEVESPGFVGRDRKEIPMTFTKEHVLQIQAECPALEDLGVRIKRIKSSAAEVEIYRSLAKIRRLKSLFLALDCSDWRVHRDSSYDPSFDGEDRDKLEYGYMKGHLREALMNCAVDETLARSIWGTIREEGSGLESLRLWTTGAGHFGKGQNNMADGYLNHLSRSWLIERVPRDDVEILHVKELCRSEREARDASGYGARRPKETEVFRSLWPSKEGSKSWQDDWSSIPLQI